MKTMIIYYQGYKYVEENIQEMVVQVHLIDISKRSEKVAELLLELVDEIKKDQGFWKYNKEAGQSDFIPWHAITRIMFR